MSALDAVLHTSVWHTTGNTSRLLRACLIVPEWLSFPCSCRKKTSTLNKPLRPLQPKVQLAAVIMVPGARSGCTYPACTFSSKSHSWASSNCDGGWIAVELLPREGCPCILENAAIVMELKNHIFVFLFCLDYDHVKLSRERTGHPGVPLMGEPLPCV